MHKRDGREGVERERVCERVSEIYMYVDDLEGERERGEGGCHREKS